MRTKSKLNTILILSIVILSFSVISFSAYCWEPTKQLELLASGSPGGGNDLTMRAIEQVLLKENPVPGLSWIVTNQGGGGGNIAMSYLLQQKGNPYIFCVNSNRVNLNPILGTTELRAGNDFTPLCRLQVEHMVWAVNSDGPYTDINVLLDKIKKDPGSITFGVGTVPSDDLFNILYVAQELGVDPNEINYISFKSGGDLITNLAGGHIDVASTSMGEALSMWEAGKVDLVSIGAPERIPAPYDKIPTWTELGINVVLTHWRGLFLAPGLTDEQVHYWSDLMAEVCSSKAWEEQLVKYEWYDAFLPHDEFAAFLEEDYQKSKDMIDRAGMLK
ncbi:MAG TPA: tripartite tricarboxylate transporter substrate-binding protein [Atribacterota bacterium]|nr:tripartite tricarboxylate transporter substrate-binding protein [Atribacterota bacterium]